MFERTHLMEAISIQSIFTLHYFDYHKSFHFDGEIHDFWELAYVDVGQVSVRAEGKEYSLKQGQMIFHMPNEYHSIWAKDDFASVVIITFETFSEAMCFFERKILKVSARQKKYIEKILEEGKAAFAEPLDIVDQREVIVSPKAPFGALQMIKTYLEQMLIDMIRCNFFAQDIKEEKGEERRAKSDEDHMVEQVIAILQNRLCDHITLDEIAAQVGFSKSYIKTQFRMNKGVSVMQMHKKMKIDYSKKLIGEQKYFITEISEMVGFNSVHYFSRTFKKVTGMTPSNYSQSVRKRALL